jgi:hypothetical protein
MATWVGTTGGGDGFSWGDANNWSPAVVPTSSQPITIESSAIPVSVAIAAAQTRGAQPLVLGATGTTEAVTLTNNGTFTANTSTTLYSGTTFDTTGTTKLNGPVTIVSGGTLGVASGGTFTATGTTTLSGVMNVSGNATVNSFVIQTGGLLDVENGGTVAASGSLNLSGTIDVAGKLTLSKFVGSGSVMVNGGTLQTAAGAAINIASSSVAFTITNGGMVAVLAPPATVSFTFGTMSAGQTNTLTIPGTTATYTAAINNFGAGDTIVLSGSSSSTGSIVPNGTGGDYTVKLGGVTLSHVTLASGTSAGNLQFANGTVVACYAQGTRILTPTGETEIERLAIGDAVMTASGATRPIKWIGRRSYAGRFLDGNRQALPVRIRAGALADGVPKRDLLVSPRHAMLIDGALVPADMLVNGASIVQESARDNIAYVHLELARHDVLVAEGAASESFVDCDSRGMFHNAAEFAALYPNDDAPTWTFCAPMLAEASEQLAGIRARLAARAGLDDACGPVSAWRGNLERVEPGSVRGWAFDSANPTTRVRLEVLVDGACIGHVVANRHRADLAQTGNFGDGRHGFDFRLPAALEPGQLVAVRRAADAVALPGSPRQVAAATFDAASRTGLARQLRGVAGTTRDAAELEELTSFLLNEAEWLRAARARLDGGARAEVEDPQNPLRGLALKDGGQVAVQPLALVLDVAAPGDGSAGLARMQGLQDLGFLVRFMAWQQPAGDTAALSAAGIGCLGTAWQGGVEEVLRRLGDRADVVLLQGAATAAAYGVLVRRFCPQARVVFGATEATATGFEQALATQLTDATLAPGEIELADAVASVLRRRECLAA